MKTCNPVLEICARLLVVLLAAIAWASPTHALQFIALETFANKLYRVDTERLGSPEFLGVIAGGSGPDLSELVIAGPNKLYSLDRAANSLWTISIGDLGNPVIVPLDRDVATHPRGMDRSPASALYGVLGMQLFTIDPATGKTAFVADITGAVGVEAIAFAPDGTLYAAGSPSDLLSSRTLYRLNPATGALSVVGTILVNGNPVSDIDTLTFATDGYLYGADSVAGVPADLIRIDPATAASTVVGNTAVTGLNGLVEDTQPLRIVTIDIKPGSDGNRINLRSQAVVHVAVLTTASFDANDVDVASVRFAGAHPLRWVVEDVDGDGDADLNVQFRIPQTNIACGDSDATLTGSTLDGVPVAGTDAILTLGCQR